MSSTAPESERRTAPSAQDPSKDTSATLVDVPRWLVPMLGDAPIRARALRMLLLVSVGMYFENYDVALLNAALPQVARDLGFGAQESAYLLAFIRLGGVGTFFLVPFADRWGRRRTFLAAMIGMGAGVLLSGSRRPRCSSCSSS